MRKMLWLAVFVIGCSGGNGGNADSQGGADQTGEITDDASVDAGDMVEDLAVPDSESDSLSDVADVGSDAQPDSADPDVTAEDGADLSDTVEQTWSVTCGDMPIMGPQGHVVIEACKSCVDDNCCDQAEACAADADCMAMRVCMLGCDTSSCSTDCWNAYPQAQTLASAFTACRNSICWEHCAAVTCFGEVQAETPEEPNYSVTMKITTTPSGTVVAGATVKFCDTDDIMCENPVATAVSGAGGQLTMSVPSSPSGLDGYFEISGEGLVTVLYHGFRYKNINSLLGNAMNPLLPAVFETSMLSTIAGMANVTMNPSDAVIFFSTRDCNEQYFSGVSVSTGAGTQDTKVVYIVGGMPSTTATETADDGSGAVFNVPTTDSKMTVEASFFGTTYSNLSVVVRPGTISSLDLVPTP